MELKLNSQKYTQLMEVFNISNELDNNIQQQSKEIQKIDTNSTQLDELKNLYNTLAEDFKLIRGTLLEIIHNNKFILNELTQEIQSVGILYLDDKKSLAYSDLVKSSNDTMKLLSLLYKDLTAIYTKIKNIDTDRNEGSGDNKVVNNTLIFANTAEILKKITKSQ